MIDHVHGDPGRACAGYSRRTGFIADDGKYFSRQFPVAYRIDESLQIASTTRYQNYHAIPGRAMSGCGLIS